jgi:hypothetical protein
MVINKKSKKEKKNNYFITRLIFINFILFFLKKLLQKLVKNYWSARA